MFFHYKPSFVRDLNKLPHDVQEEALEKIELFKDINNHQKLRVHKLQGKLKDRYSFSVTFAHRIVFKYEEKNTVIFLTIGTHDIYR